jgi:hypothetical protein
MFAIEIENIEKIKIQYHTIEKTIAIEFFNPALFFNLARLILPNIEKSVGCDD